MGHCPTYERLLSKASSLEGLSSPSMTVSLVFFYLQSFLENKYRSHFQELPVLPLCRQKFPLSCRAVAKALSFKIEDSAQEKLLEPCADLSRATHQRYFNSEDQASNIQEMTVSACAADRKTSNDKALQASKWLHQRALSAVDVLIMTPASTPLAQIVPRAPPEESLAAQ